jgi:putative ABC transport system permease protein
LAGVESTAFSTSVPGFGRGSARLQVEGRPPVDRWEDYPEVLTSIVSPGFFRTTGLAIVRGRVFNEQDGNRGAETLIVDERFAATIFPGEDPIGRRVRFPNSPTSTGQPEPVWRTIVGVSRSVNDLPEPGSSRPTGALYIPHRQSVPSGTTVLIRSRLDPVAVMNAVRREVQQIDPDQPVFTVRTIEQQMKEATWPYRIFGTLFAAFALIALVLSAVGLYAVMAYSVTQRTAEIGVRMALGADRRRVSWLVLRRGLVQLAIGLSLGLAGAYAASQVLGELLAGGVTPHDPVTFAAISVILIAVAVAACLIPAHRATRIDPLVALRE